MVPVSFANLCCAGQAAPHQPRHIAEGREVPQEDEEGVGGNRGHALVAVEGPAVAIAICTVGAQGARVPHLALRVLVGCIAS